MQTSRLCYFSHPYVSKLFFQQWRHYNYLECYFPMFGIEPQVVSFLLRQAVHDASFVINANIYNVIFHYDNDGIKKALVRIMDNQKC